ncbi:TetR/AcrR family transcriptional regulator [Nocardia asteroides]|uniref:TetR/AcrR family transcriptional regulator n=1 Tax=Nocardia asteroides TaxID=1824 RepID=UPI0037CC7C6A
MTDPDRATLPVGAIGQEVLRLLTGLPAQPLPRHRHDLSRDDVRAAQTARIVAAAVELFAAQGYASTTVMEIAKRAGVSRKTIYDFYDSKEDIFLDTYHAVEVLVAEAGLAEAARDSAADPQLDQLAGAVERLLLFLQFVPAATQMFFFEAVGAGPRVRSRRNAAIAEFVEVIAPPLQAVRAKYEPGLSPLSIEICRALVAGAIELIIEYLADHDIDDLHLLAPRLVELVGTIVAPNFVAQAVRPADQ